MLGDWDKFSCSACAAAPTLTKVLGCFEDAGRVVAEYAKFEFTRCPVKYQTERSIVLARQGFEGYLKALGPVAARLIPAKRHAALLYIENYLLKLKKLGEGTDVD